MNGQAHWITGKTALPLLAAMLLGAQRQALAVDGTPSWFQSQVTTASPGFSLSSPALAFDHFGTPSVTWSSVADVTGTNQVTRSELLGLGIWAHHSIATGTGVGLQTALSFDRAERPTVAWINTSGDVFAEFDNSGVQTLVANGAGTQDPILSLSHDLAGNLRGLFAGATTGELFDIGGSGGSFSSGMMTTLSGIDPLNDVRMTTDHSGLRHVVARGELTPGVEGVVLASEPSFGGVWPMMTFATADVVHGAAVAVDPGDGNLAIAYTTFDNATSTSRLFYAKSDGFQLQPTEVLASTTAVFQDVDLAFDFSDGLPAIAFEQAVVSPAAEQMMFAFLDPAAQWQTSLVDDSVSLEHPLARSRRPSLAFDDFGTSFPAIAYIDADGSLAVAFDPPVPEPATLALLALGLLLPTRRRGLRGP